MNTSTSTRELPVTSLNELTPSQPDDILTLLLTWSDKGWLRRLDSAMATFMQELDTSASCPAGQHGGSCADGRSGAHLPAVASSSQ